MFTITVFTFQIVRTSICFTWTAVRGGSQAQNRNGVKPMPEPLKQFC